MGIRIKRMDDTGNWNTINRLRNLGTSSKRRIIRTINKKSRRSTLRRSGSGIGGGYQNQRIGRRLPRNRLPRNWLPRNLFPKTETRSLSFASTSPSVQQIKAVATGRNFLRFASTVSPRLKVSITDSDDFCFAILVAFLIPH